jgi:hypothetical protein
VNLAPSHRQSDASIQTPGKLAVKRAALRQQRAGMVVAEDGEAIVEAVSEVPVDIGGGRAPIESVRRRGSQNDLGRWFLTGRAADDEAHTARARRSDT